MSTAQISAGRPRALSDAEVDQLDPYAFFAVLRKRVIHPGGRAATDALIRRADFRPAPRVLDVACPGMQFESVGDWVRRCSAEGIADIPVETGHFNMMTPAGFLHDEGLVNSAAVMGRAMSRLSYARKMAWLMPRVARAVPYLGFILASGTRPAPTGDA